MATHVVSLPVSFNFKPILPVFAARRADDVVERVGVCVGGTYASGSTAGNNAARMLGDMGIRHARIGLQDMTSVQADIANKLGAKVITSPNGRGSVNGIDVITSTPWRAGNDEATRINDALTNWTTAKIRGWEGMNEPQRSGAVSVANWQNSYSTDGPPAASPWQQIGKNEVKRTQHAIRVARDNSSRPNVALVAPPFASRSQLGWPGSLGRMSYPGDITVGNVHCYPGGVNFLKGGLLANQISEASDILHPSEIGPLTVDVTETGWHSMNPHTGTHKYTPEDVRAVYLPRLPLEADDLRAHPETTGNNILGIVYIYEIADDPNAGQADSTYEQKFGSFYNADGTTVKDAGAAWNRLRNIYWDPNGTSFTPTSLNLSVAGGKSTMQVRVHQRSDGTHIVALWLNESVWTPETTGTNPVAGFYTPVADVTATLTLPVGRAVTSTRVTPGTVNSLGSSGSYTIPVGPDVTLLEVAP